MKNRPTLPLLFRHGGLAALAGLLLQWTPPAWSQGTLNGDHIITGSLDVLGSSFGLGTFGTDPDQPGFSLTASPFDYYVEGYEDPFQVAQIIMQPTNSGLAGTEYYWRDGSGNILLRLKLHDFGEPFDNGLHVNLPVRAHAGLYVEGLVYANNSPVLTSATFTTGLNSNIALTAGNNRTIGVQSSANGNGRSLTVSAGGASGTNQSGGPLILQSGASTGTGSSAIEFRTAPPGASPTGRNPAVTRMTITGSGNVGIGTSNPSTRLHVVGQAMAGVGLTSTTLSQVVVGRHNDSAIDNSTGTPNDRSEGVFIVGAGSGATGQPIPAVQNAMRILPDGTILILPKGDLEMGDDFQQGPRP